MKALIVSHLWPRSDWPWLGIFVADQVASLAKRCDVSVVAPVDRTIRRKEITPHELLSGLPKYRHRTRPEMLSLQGIQPLCVPFRARLFRETFAQSSVRRLAGALEQVSLDGVDLVHAHTIFPDGLACALWLEKRAIPLVVTIHGNDVYYIRAGARKAVRSLINQVDALVPVSRYLGDLLKEYGAEPARIHVIPNGFLSEPFKKAEDTNRNPKKLVYLGRLDAHKRLDLLIDALAQCQDDIVLDIAGDGFVRKNLEAQVRKLGLENRIRFLGTMPREDVPRFLAGAALMCLVSTREGWPTVIFEALACGTPVLATAVGGNPEALEPPGLGEVVPVDITADELAKKIESTIRFDWDRQFIKEHAFRHSWDEVAAQLAQLYSSLLEAQMPESSKVSPSRGS